MQTWAKRGLQTALVTGGLLMLGTGIASADEDVNPDKPASPLDGSVNVPVHMDNNVLGTPLGQKVLPRLHQDVNVSAAQVTGRLPVAQQAAPLTDPLAAKAADAAAPAVRSVQDKATPAVEQGRDQAAPMVADKTKPVTDKLAGLPGGDKLPRVPNLDKVAVPGVDAFHAGPAGGNRINADLVVPVDISGNAIAALGNAETTNESDHSYGTDRDVYTSGRGTFIGGNVVDLDWAMPVQVTNNAISGVGKASAEGTSSQEAWATGDIMSNGEHSFLGGNVIAPQFATPVQVDGNAIAGAGKSTASSEAQSSAESGGWILTSGADSAGGGNAVPVPVAVPTKVNGNAIMGLGKAVAMSDSSADAQAGRTRPGMYGVPTYVETNGDPALAAGNIAQPAVSGPVLVCGNAGGVGGVADATCDTASETVAGGTSRTTGQGSVASGSIASPAVALPAEVFGNAVTGVGKATADATNSVDSTAGGASYTRGHDSVLSGSAANATAAGAVDIFANSVAGVGKASSTAANTATTTAGGHTGTTGDNSAGGGNTATVPMATPAELFGNTAATAGGADATASEIKESCSGGGNNTDDDNGVLASNLATVPVASAVQAFGNGAGLVAVTDSRAKAVDEVTAGGDNNATGHSGVGSGNIGQVPVSLPVQLFGTGASGLAKGSQIAINDLESEAGGDATSDGAHAAGSGNVVNAPVAGAAQFYGESVAAMGLNRALAGSVTETEAGGDTETTGRGSAISGNVVSPQALPLAQSSAATAAGVGGVNSSKATNKTDAESGGDIDTDGDAGSLSGNLVDVPAAAAVQPFGDAVSAVGSKSSAQGLSNTQGDVGGTSTTNGAFGSLSGLDATAPAGANAPIYDVPVEVLAKAFTESANTGQMQVGEGEPQLNLPVSGGLSPTELPSVMPKQRSMPADPFAGVFSGVLSGLTGGLPGQDVLGGVHTLPAPMGRTATATPVDGLLGGLGDPTGGLSNGLSFGGQSMGELPTGGRSAGFAPPVVGDLLGNLPVVSGLGAGPSFAGFGGRSLPAETPFFGDLLDVTTIIPAVPAAGAQPDVTTIIPAVPAAGGLSDDTAVMPAVPASGEFSDVPVVQAPQVGTLPVPTPSVAGVQGPGAVQGMNGSSLDSTRAALANLFSTRSIG